MKENRNYSFEGKGRSKLVLPASVNSTIRNLLDRTREFGTEHATTFRSTKHGPKSRRIREGSEDTSKPMSVAELYARKLVARFPPIIVHTHPPAVQDNITYSNPIFAPNLNGFNTTPTKDDIFYAVAHPGTLFLIASDNGVVAMTEEHFGSRAKFMMLIDEGLLRDYLRLAPHCKNDPAEIEKALIALATLWKPHGHIYARLGNNSDPLNLVSASALTNN